MALAAMSGDELMSLPRQSRSRPLAAPSEEADKEVRIRRPGQLRRLLRRDGLRFDKRAGDLHRVQPREPGAGGLASVIREQRDRPIRQRLNRETPAIRAGQPACMPWSRSPLRNACCVRNVSNLDIALISAGAALGGVLLGQVSAYVTDRLKERRAARDARDQAIADVLTSVVDLVTGVQAIRAAYEGQSGWRQLARRAAVLLSAFGSEYGSPAGLRVDEILDWKRLAPFFDSLLVYMRDMDHRQRIQALDVGTMLLPRTDRFYSAVAVLSLGPDKDVARAVRKLTPAVGALLEAAGDPQRKYDRARRRVEKALGAFRDAVDARRGA